MDVHRLKMEGEHATGAPLVPTPMYGNSLTQKDDSCKLCYSGICCDCHVLVT